jgi:hypothetical protein
MGQAKRRGTFEERKAQAIEREEHAEDARDEAKCQRLAAMTPAQREAEERAQRRTASRLLTMFALTHGLIGYQQRRLA